MPIQPAPSLVPIYKTTLTTIVDENVTTWAGVDIGVEHPSRIVVLACFTTGEAPGTITVNGEAAIAIRAVPGQVLFPLFEAQIPSGETAEIVWSVTSSARKAVSVYVAYPNEPLPIDAGSAVAAGAANAAVSGLKAVEGGFAIYVGGQAATALGNPYAVTWTGPDAVAADVNANFGAVERSSYTMGHIDFTAASELDDLVLAEVVPGFKVVAACSWGPPYESPCEWFDATTGTWLDAAAHSWIGAGSAAGWHDSATPSWYTPKDC